jgi:hypothetical protein
VILDPYKDIIQFYKALIQFFVTLACAGIGWLMLQLDWLAGIEIMGLFSIFLNWALFNPEFVYTEGSNDIIEAIADGIYCSIIPAIIYGAAISYFGSLIQGLIAGFIFVAATITIHYGINKILCRPRGHF